MMPGDRVVLTVNLTGNRMPEHGYMRIESAPMVTEHVVMIALPPFARRS